jgi:hypothetical protein
MRISTRALSAAVALCLFGVALAAGIPSAGAAGTASTAVVTVVSGHVWTPTGVQLRAGDEVVIRASGRMRFGAPPINRLTPTGVRRGPTCATIGGARSDGWPAADLNCWSLIARVGTGHPFAVGDARSLRVSTAGELQLGINDNHLEDNAGSWSASVTVTPAAPSAPAPASAPRAARKSSILVPVIAVVAFAVLGLLVALLWRRRRAPVREAQVAPVPPAVVDAGAPLPAIDSTVGNFLDVEFTADGRLSVGYNHFPVDTVVSWSATCGGARQYAGEFVTEGGGEARHTTEIVVGEIAVGDRDGHGPEADLTFTWAVAGVPFRYSVRRSVPAGAEHLH